MIYWSILDCAKVELLQVYFRYTLDISHLKTNINKKIIQSSSLVTLKHILGLILGNVNCAQVVLQIKLNYDFISLSLEGYASKYVNRFELYLVFNQYFEFY